MLLENSYCHETARSPNGRITYAHVTDDSCHQLILRTIESIQPGEVEQIIATHVWPYFPFVWYQILATGSIEGDKESL